MLSTASDQQRIYGKKVYLRPPRNDDHAEWAALRLKSRAFLEKWEPTWLPDELSRHQFRERIRRYILDQKGDHGFHYFVYRIDDDALVGGLNLTNIRRGVAQSATLGYWAGEIQAGQGLMSDAVRTLLPLAFNTHRLRRIEAGCLPANERSIALLEAVGFHPEGLARQYLRINGEWEDHLLFAILRSDPIRSAALAKARLQPKAAASG